MIAATSPAPTRSTRNVPLPRSKALPEPIAVQLEPLVRLALLEDLGRAGDLTTEAIVPAQARAQAAVVAREAGVIAGLECARLAFALLDLHCDFEARVSDGAPVLAGATVATIRGSARALLTGERTALNFLCRLSGIATATHHLVGLIKHETARITCTRKTTPGLRMLEKYAVSAGGGMNHRFGLDDAVLIKDNHIALAGGIVPAVERVRERVGHLVKIELEVDTLQQLREALSTQIDAVLLDNMTPAELSQAVQTVGGKLITEASGGIDARNLLPIARTGVDLISVGWLTHSAPSLDIALDIIG
ncbi:MAG: carboxylating nicotinate-nucleotide diphosphorylase [Candidatus Eremiobacteraeota bacterium]|nr:carboxylating nicotinate-nucleotide diphosphorylase [Candidatus Eremiobacteraeota bacterium]